MFEKQIQLAQDMIRRLHLCAEKGLDSVPSSEQVYGAEMDAWDSANEQLIIHSFGANSSELSRYYLVKQSKDPYPATDVYSSWIHYYLKMIGLLQELEAKYAAIQAEKQPPIKEFVMGNKYNFGNVTGSIINVDSVLEQVTQNIGSAPNIDEAGKKQLAELIEQLKIELQKTPVEKREDAEDLADSAKALVEAGTKEQPNKKTVQSNASRLKQAAEDIASVMPTVSIIAVSIVKTVLQLAGIPLP